MTPANPSTPAGLTTQFTATGTYSDGTSRDITSSVSWNSATPSVATIDASGLASTLTTGTSVITATSGSVSGNTTLTVTAAALQSIAVTPATPSTPVGLTVQLTATGTYTDGSTQDLTSSVTWSSGTTSVATVSSSGLATGVTAGTSVITATSGSVSANTTLTVTAATLQSLAVTPANPSTPAGLTVQFTATGTYSDASTKDITATVTWTSGATSVATVDTNGLATGVTTGTAQITATSGSVSGNTTLTVTAATLQSVTVTPADPATPLGDTTQFTATGNYSDASTQDLTASVTWSSGTTSVATIDANGLASTLTQGTSLITATTGSLSGSTTLTVTAAALQSIVVAPPSSSTPAGLTTQFTATGTYSDGTTQDVTSSVTWSSDYPLTASVDPATGLATGHLPGATVTITASSGSVSATSSMTVTMATQLDDIAVDVISPSDATNFGDTIQKLNATDGTISWGPVTQANCGGIAVDQVDFGVYFGATANCGGGSGVYKYDASGNLAWNNTSALTACGGCNGYYIGNGGVAVDTSSSDPGVVLTESGCYGTIGKVSRTDGSQLFCNSSDDVGRPTIDPSNGWSYAITNAGPRSPYYPYYQYPYNTMYATTPSGSFVSLPSSVSCEGYTDLNPADGMLYRGGGMASNGCGLTLAQMDKANLTGYTWIMDLSPYLSSFDALAVQPWSGGYIYVASVTDSKIAVVDPATQSVVRTFSTAVAPQYIAVGAYGGNVYVASGSSHFVYAYSPTGTLVWTSPDLGGNVSNIATARAVVGGP